MEASLLALAKSIYYQDIAVITKNRSLKTFGIKTKRPL